MVPLSGKSLCRTDTGADPPNSKGKQCHTNKDSKRTSLQFCKGQYGSGDIRGAGPRSSSFPLRPRTSPQGGNWGTKVLSVSSALCVRGRSEGECRSSFGIHEGVHRLGLGGVVMGGFILFSFTYTFVIIFYKFEKWDNVVISKRTTNTVAMNPWQ